MHASVGRTSVLKVEGAGSTPAGRIMVGFDLAGHVPQHTEIETDHVREYTLSRPSQPPRKTNEPWRVEKLPVIQVARGTARWLLREEIILDTDRFFGECAGNAGATCSSLR
jgi:hypothetical protein